jgi:serine/threonine protein kinase
MPFKDGDRFGEYELIERLGEPGGFGEAWKVKQDTDYESPFLVLKILNKERYRNIDKSIIRTEAATWTTISNHKNIANFIRVILLDDEIGFLSIYYPDGTLDDWLRNNDYKSPTIEKAVEIMLGILEGIEHIHSKNIVHRDLKPKNIVLSREHPLIIDFGISTALGNNPTKKTNTFWGTHGYSAPEAYLGDRGKSLDVFSAGVILYEILVGNLPFQPVGNQEIKDAVIENPPVSDLRELPEKLREVVFKALEKDPQRRFHTITEMREALEEASEHLDSKPTKIIKLAIALGNDILFDKADVTNEIEVKIHQINENKPFNTKIELVWCNETNSYDSQDEWSQYFYFDTPVYLLKRIKEVHNPDFIIPIFWKTLGSSEKFTEIDSAMSKMQAAKDIAKEWFASDHPKAKYLFCRQEPNLPQEEKFKRLFFTYFRAEGKQKDFIDCNKNQLPAEIEKILLDFLKDNSTNTENEIDIQELNKNIRIMELANLPVGWLYLNKYLKDEIRNIGKELSKVEAENFFSGTNPKFREAISCTVPRRSINKDLEEIINNAVNNNLFAVTLLQGAGGEGKSTVLKQVAVDLIIKQKSNIHVIFNQDSGDLSKLIDCLEFKNGSFIIVSDNGQYLAEQIAKLAKRESQPRNIHILVASRTTHWEWKKKADREILTNLGTNFQKRTIGILTREDADKIIRVWEKASSLGKLAEIDSHESRVERLLNEAESKFDRSGLTNSFFSAILWVRQNETLDGRVGDILDELESRNSLNGKTLKHYFNYILALHGDGIHILTNRVLQKTLGCDEITLKQEVLEPLTGEIPVLQEESSLILARHDVFAERAKEILKNQVDFNNKIGELAVAAEKLYRELGYDFVENERWTTLKDVYFKERRKPEIALEIVKAIATDEELKSDPIMVARWANLLSNWGAILEKKGKTNEAREKYQAAHNILNQNYDQLIPNRGYLTDWGVLERKRGNNFLSAWLTAIALSGKVTEKLIGKQPRPVLVRLTSLAKSFSFSLKNTALNAEHLSILKKATDGIIKLGFNDNSLKNLDDLSIKYDKDRDYKRTMDSLDEIVRVNKLDVSKINLENSFHSILDGLNLAWELCEINKTTLPKNLPKVSDLEFNNLKKIFGIKS